MRKTRIFALMLALILLFLVGCEGQAPAASSTPIDVKPAHTSPVTTAVPAVTANPSATKTPLAFPEGSPDSDVIRSHNTIGFSLLRELSEGGRNVILSPVSIALALQLVSNGADEKALTGVHKTFGTGIVPAILNEDNAKLIRMLTSDKPEGVSDSDRPVVKIVNGIFGKFPFSSTFSDTALNYYRASANQFDYASPDAKNKINDYISQQTNGMVPALVDEDLDPSTALTILNALCFEGKWNSSFNTANIRKDDFIGANDTVNTDFMLQTNNYLYGEYNDAQIVSIPYKGGYSMILMLPATDVPPEEFLFELDAGSFSELLSGLSEQNVKLLLPKFNLDCAFSLRESLIASGMEDSFSEGSGSYAALFNGQIQKIAIDDVLYGTYIKVDETGTAASLSGSTITANPTSTQEPVANNPYEVEATHPFAFAIVHDRTGSILYLGAVNDIG